ncbi:hypothetical protein V2W45_1466592 [Cenococcum geophilum]
MANLSKLNIIKIKPIGEGLNGFCDLFNLIYKDLGVSNSLNISRQISNKELKDILLNLILALQSLPTSHLLPSNSGNKNLLSDLLRLNLVVNLDGFNIEYFTNSSKHRKYELGPFYVGIPGLYKAFFRGVKGLKEASAVVFKKCKEGDNPLYAEKGGWCDWPKSAEQDNLVRKLDIGELKRKYIREVFAAQDTRCFEYNQMNKEQLGFDPTILTLDGKRYIKIRLILNKVIKRARCVTGHYKGDTSKKPLYLEREKEGKLLLVNVARYYHHKIIRVGGQDNNIFNIPTNYKPEGLIMPLRLAGVQGSIRKGQSSSRKRSSSYSAPLPPGKRLCLTSLTKRPIIQNRAAMLTALEGGIKGYKSLYMQAGNLIINKEDNNPS